LRQATSTFGALVGATVAGLAFKLSGSNYVLTFALSAIPAFLALLLVTAVRSRRLSSWINPHTGTCICFLARVRTPRRHAAFLVPARPHSFGR